MKLVEYMDNVQNVNEFMKKENEMLIKTKTTLVGGQKAGIFPFDNCTTDSIYDIEESEINYCCKLMEEAFQEGFIGFGEFNVERPLNKNNNVNIFHCSPYPEGAVWNEMAIELCPWCKEKIQILNIETKFL